jgi:hypothetical protein
MSDSKSSDILSDGPVKYILKPDSCDLMTTRLYWSVISVMTEIIRLKNLILMEKQRTNKLNKVTSKYLFVNEQNVDLG